MLFLSYFFKYCKINGLLELDSSREVVQKHKQTVTFFFFNVFKTLKKNWMKKGYIWYNIWDLKRCLTSYIKKEVWSVLSKIYWVLPILWVDETCLLEFQSIIELMGAKFSQKSWSEWHNIPLVLLHTQCALGSLFDSL